MGRIGMDSDSSKAVMLNKLYAFHVRGGHPSADRLFQLYRRLFGKNHSSKVTLDSIRKRLQACKCYTTREKSKGYVPVLPSTNAQLFLDFKEVGGNKCPIGSNGAKFHRLTIVEPLSGAVWTLPTPFCTGKKVVELLRIVLQVHGMVRILRPDNAPAFVHGDLASFVATTTSRSFVHQ